VERIESLFRSDAMKKLMVVLAVGLLVAAENKDDAKKDLDKLQGEWTCVSGERDGENFPEEVAKSLKRTVKGDKSDVTRDGKSVAKTTLVLAAEKKPKTIDMKLEGEDQMLHGIYELDGDTFKLCYAPPGAERPKEFATKAGSGLTLSVWKKVKK
jgi:uncharacterized protein (TIGR03067 family)